MIDLLVFAVGFSLVLIALFAISDALVERQAERERVSRGDVPSHVRIVRRPYDWDRDR